MARQDTFTLEEWTLLRLAPSLVAGGIAAADPSGLFASIKEAAAGARGMAEAFKANSGLELFAAFAADRSIPGIPDPKTLLGEGSREQQMHNFERVVLERVKAALEVLAGKASAAEVEAYKTMLVDVARQAANASKEGGFLGFGGVRVSDKEHAFIDKLKGAVGLA